MTKILSIIAVLLVLTSAASAPAAEVKMDEKTKKATAKALEWLAAKQNADGSWSTGHYAHNTAITAFALLAFMSQGHLPNQGLYGPEVARGGRFLLASARPVDGYLVGSRGGNMYAHGMATLALAELWGNTGDDAIKPVLQKAVNLIVRCQDSSGGWRYEPRPSGADISATIMQVMALRAARNSGLHVPDLTLKKAIGYIERCYNAKRGGFGYQSGRDTPGFARTAAGLCVLFLTGEYNARQIPQAVEYLKKNFNAPEYLYYGHYYAAHAMHQVGGKEWEDWYARVCRHFLPLQAADGSWTFAGRNGSVGPVYETSIAVIILSVPADYLPIFQR
jgi:Prenyltransferase and squalene oxidase repeat